MHSVQALTMLPKKLSLTELKTDRCHSILGQVLSPEVGATLATGCHTWGVLYLSISPKFQFAALHFACCNLTGAPVQELAGASEKREQ